MSRTLIITEKSSVSKPMAAAMGWKQIAGGGFTGRLGSEEIMLLPARGHLLAFESPDEIDPSLGWDQPHKLAAIPRALKLVPIIEEPSPNQKGPLSQEYLARIGNALKDADRVILATDADREGEYIGWSILEHFSFKGDVRRCWLGGGMDEQTMKQALTNLLPAKEKRSLARAGEARARCDWAYMYLVRLLTHYGRHGLLGEFLGRGAGRESVVSAGRVQSAALYIIYKREMEIRNFVPKSFFKVFADFGVAGTSLEAEYDPKVTQQLIDSMPPGIIWEPQGLEGENKLDRPLFTGKTEVKDFEARLLQYANQAKVLEYKESTSTKHPDKTLNLVGAQSALAKRCKVTGDVAQAIIEDLYEQGYISYPRTAKSELPLSMYEPVERDPMLRAVMGVPGLGAAAQKALDIHSGKDSDYKPFKPKVFVTSKLEHHGLVPTKRSVDQRALLSMVPRKQITVRGKQGVHHTDAHMREAYQLIAESFVRAMLPPATYATQKIVFSVPTQDLLGSPNSLFSADAKRTVDSGYLGILSLQGDKTNTLPKLKNGDAAKVESVELKTGETKKPSRFSEISFLQALEKAAREIDDPVLRKIMADESSKPAGIGTPSTRKDIVPTIKARGYVSSDAKGIYALEPKGEEYIKFQIKHGKKWMYLVETTAEWENKLSDLAELEDDVEACRLRDVFVEETLRNIEDYINWMNHLFADVEKKALPRLASAVTPRMKEAIKSIATRKNLNLPPKTLTDPALASAFLNEHMPKRAEGSSGDGSDGSGTYAPSDAQLSYLAKIEASIGVKATDEEKADRKLLSEFLDRHKKKMDAQYNGAPPTEKMISFAKSLASKLPADKQPPETVYQRMDECRAFIEKQKKASEGSKGSSSGARGSARPGSTNNNKKR